MNNFSPFLTSLSIILVLLKTGCIERSINPFEEDANLYSVYAALDLDEDLNYIRIRDLNTHFLAEQKGELDLTVIFEDLENGTSSILRDTIVDFAGNLTHNYIVESSLIPRRTYQLTLLADNDRTIRSLATTPGITEASISQSEDVPCSRSLTFTFKNVIYPEHVRMEVGFHYDNSIHWAEIGHVAQLEHNLAEQEMSVRMSPRNLLAEVYPPRPEDTIGIHPLNWTPRVLCHELDNEIILIRYVHFGPEWTAVRPFWPVNPFNISDVENGLGFFGAVRRDSFSFTVIQ